VNIGTVHQMAVKFNRKSLDAFALKGPQSIGSNQTIMPRKATTDCCCDAGNCPEINDIDLLLNF